MKIYVIKVELQLYDNFGDLHRHEYLVPCTTIDIVELEIHDILVKELRSFRSAFKNFDMSGINELFQTTSRYNHYPLFNCNTPIGILQEPYVMSVYANSYDSYSFVLCNKYDFSSNCYMRIGVEKVELRGDIK